MIITWMNNKTKNPVKFPLTQPVRDEYAEFLFSKVFRARSPQILICVINIIITLEIDMGF